MTKEEVTKEERIKYMQDAKENLELMKFHTENLKHDLEFFRRNMDEEMFSEEDKILFFAIFSDIDDAATTAFQTGRFIVMLMAATSFKSNGRQKITEKEFEIAEEAAELIDFCKRAHKEVYDIVFGRQNNDGGLRYFRHEEALKAKAAAEAAGDDDLAERYQRLAEREKAEEESHTRRINMLLS